MLHIQVVGLGCPRRAELARRAEGAAQRLGKVYRLEKVSDLDRVVEVGVPVPALLVNGTACAAGTVPSLAAIEAMLSRAGSSSAAAVAGEGAPIR